MKTTPFVDVHITLGTKMHEFAGFDMPTEYSEIIGEHATVVNSVGVFDVSHMGELWVEGPNVLAFTRSTTSNDASTLSLGEAQYTCSPNDKGDIVDDPSVHHYESEKYLLVVNAGNIDEGWDWCVSHDTVGAELENSSDRAAQLAVQGPKTQEVLQRLTPVDLSSIPYYSFVTGKSADCKNVIISSTGYTGAGGFELYFYPSDTMTIWNAIFKIGKSEGIKPIGLGVRGTLRLEMDLCLYGNDLDGTTSPIETGLGWITKFTESKNFTNRTELKYQKKEGITRKLRVFELQEKGIPRRGYEIVDAKGDVIGAVASGMVSPVPKKGIGMKYAKPEFAKAGTDISIKVRNKNLKVQVAKAPFRR